MTIAFLWTFMGSELSELRDAVSQGISTARTRELDTIRFIHGFNRGDALSQTLQAILYQLKKGGQVTSSEINPSNPGETIVRLP